MDRVAALDDPQLRAFAPLIFVAWSDDDLDAGVRERVLAQVAAEPWLRPAARAVLAAWMDPAAPPTAAELAQLHALIEHVKTTASPRDQLAVADRIGRELGIYAGTAPAPAPRAPDRALIDGLRAVLDGEHADVRDRVRAFLGDHRAYGLSADAERVKVRGWLRELAATQLPALAFPGVTSDRDLAAFTAVFEELGHGNSSLLVKLGVQVGLYGAAIWALGTARHHARLAKIAAFEELGCFAMSEVGHGSNVASLETVARYDAATRELEVHTPGESARKEWIGGAAHDARWAVVFAQLEVAGVRHGVHAVLVPIRDAASAPLPGVRTGDSGHKLGLNGVDNGRLWFERVRVPADNLLDRFATITDGTYASPIASADKRFFTMLGALIGGRVSVASASVSVARTALAIAVRYAHARRQFGQLLMDYPTHRRRLLPHVADSVVLRIACAALRKRHAAAVVGSDTRELEAEAAAMKVLCSRHAVAAVQDAREACGGQGYLSVNRIPELRADVDIFTTFEGDNTVLAQLVGKALLGAERKQLTAGGTLAVVRAVARRLAPRNPLAARRTDDVGDRDFHLATLRHREQSLVETCVLRIKKRLDAGADGDTAVLAVQEHVVAIATAFAERRALEWFAEAEAAAPAAVQPLLAQLGTLFALARLASHAAWFLESGYFEPSKLRAIRKAQDALLAELAPLSRDLAEAFAIPDACLAAPIAFFDPAHPTY
jgi:acyl-CoA oxidase